MPSSRIFVPARTPVPDHAPSSRVDADRLDALLGTWVATRAVLVAGRRVIAIDGKTVRGARDGDASAPHLVAALAHGSGTVLGQVAVREKSNEIPAARHLLEILDLHGAVVTMDALHTQHATAAYVTESGADYVLTVKANQKSLYARLKALPWARIPAVTRTDRGLGRRATRTLKAIDVPARGRRTPRHGEPPQYRDHPPPPPRPPEHRRSPTTPRPRHRPAHQPPPDRVINNFAGALGGPAPSRASTTNGTVTVGGSAGPGTAVRIRVLRWSIASRRQARAGSRRRPRGCRVRPGGDVRNRRRLFAGKQGNGRLGTNRIRGDLASPGEAAPIKIN